MLGFFEIKSEKWPVWGLFASVLVVFVGFTLVFKDFGSSESIKDPLALKCDNPECTYAEKLTRPEKRLRAKANYVGLKAENPEMAKALLDRTYQDEVADELDPGAEELFTEEYLLDILSKTWGNTSRGPAFKCPLCGQKTVWDAIACPNPKSCDNIFLRGEFRGLYSDKCPKCEYSPREARQQKDRGDKQRHLQQQKDLKEQRRNK